MAPWFRLRVPQEATVVSPAGRPGRDSWPRVARERATDGRQGGPGLRLVAWLRGGLALTGPAMVGGGRAGAGLAPGSVLVSLRVCTRSEIGHRCSQEGNSVTSAAAVASALWSQGRGVRVQRSRDQVGGA